MIVRNDRNESCVNISFTTECNKMYSRKKGSIISNECCSLMFIGRYESNFRLKVNKSRLSSRHLYIPTSSGLREPAPVSAGCFRIGISILGRVPGAAGEVNYLLLGLWFSILLFSKRKKVEVTTR